MKKLRVIQIGLGHDHATSALNSILKQDDLYTVCGLAIPPCEEERYGSRAQEYIDRGLPYMSVEELLSLPDLDCAVIETEEKNLTAYAKMAAERGLHIYMDKPGGMDYAVFCDLIHCIKEKHLHFAVGYMYRYNPFVLEAKEKIAAGELGEVYCVEAHMDCEHGESKRAWLGDLPGGMLFFLGCHLIDLVFGFMGEPQEILPLNCSTGIGGVKADDYGMAVYRYPHGISFVKSCAAEVGGFRRRQLVICGEKGTIEIKPFEILTDVRDELESVMRHARPGMGWNDPGTLTTSPHYNRFDPMLRDFAEVVNGIKVSEYGPDYELAVYRMVLRSCGVEV